MQLIRIIIIRFILSFVYILIMDKYSLYKVYCFVYLFIIYSVYKIYSYNTLFKKENF